MKVRDILRVKGSTLFTVAPDTALQTAVLVMSEHDIGSLVVMEYDKLVGILTFREVIAALAKHHGKLEGLQVHSVMNQKPLTCNMDVAKSVVEAQDFENTMLKAYIRDWPEDTEKAAS
jgi:CBS domain-containing protein